MSIFLYIAIWLYIAILLYDHVFLKVKGYGNRRFSVRTVTSSAIEERTISNLARHPHLGGMLSPMRSAITVSMKIDGDERLRHLHSIHAHIFPVLVRLVNIFNCFAKFMIDAHIFHAWFSWYNHFLSSP